MSKSLKYVIPLLLIGLFMVSYAALADGGQQGGSNDSGHNSVDQQEQSDHRQVQVEYNPSDNSIQIQSQNHNNGTNTNIEITLSAGDGGLQVNFQYSGESANHTESHLGIKLKATNLVEFMDNKTAGQLNGLDGNDTVLKTINLQNLSWNLSLTNQTLSNNSLWIMTATTTVNTNATLTFQFLLTDGFFAMAGNNTLTPNLIKFSVSLLNYKFENSQSQIALQTIFKSNLNSDHISNQTEDHTDGFTHNSQSAVNFANGTTAGFFSWADNYTVNGQSKPIISSPAVTVDKEDNTYNQMYFSFLQGSNITWDPSVGVTLATTSPGAILSLLSSNSSLSSAKSTPGFEYLVALSSIVVLATYSKRYIKK